MGKAILLAIALVLATSPEHQLFVLSAAVYTLLTLGLLDSIWPEGELAWQSERMANI